MVEYNSVTFGYDEKILKVGEAAESEASGRASSLVFYDDASEAFDATWHA